MSDAGSPGAAGECARLSDELEQAAFEPSELRAEALEHLDSCIRCRHAFESERRWWGVARSLPLLPLPEGMEAPPVLPLAPPRVRVERRAARAKARPALRVAPPVPGVRTAPSTSASEPRERQRPGKGRLSLGRVAVAMGLLVVLLGGVSGIFWRVTRAPRRSTSAELTSAVSVEHPPPDQKSGRILATLDHGQSVLSAAFSLDGNWAVTASNDGTAAVWHSDSGQQKARMQGHTAGIRTATFSPDGQRVVTAGGSDGTIRLWNAETGRLRRVLQGCGGFVHTAAFSPDGHAVVAACSDGHAYVWRAEGELMHQLMGHSDAVKTAVYSRDRKHLVTASADGTARIWDARTGESLRVLSAHKAGLQMAAFSPDGSRVITTSDDGTARIWGVASGEQVLEFRGHRAPVLAAVFSHDGKRAVTSSQDGEVWMWNARSGKSIRPLIEHGQLVKAIDFSPNDRCVVAGTEDGSVHLWRDGRGLALIQQGLSAVWSVKFSPRGDRILAATENKKAVLIDSSECGQNGPTASTPARPAAARLPAGPRPPRASVRADPTVGT